MRLSASEPPEKTESDHINISKSQNLELRVYASQNGQKKETSLKTTKHVLSQFFFHKKLSLHSYFSSRGLIQSQNHFFFEKN